MFYHRMSYMYHWNIDTAPRSFKFYKLYSYKTNSFSKQDQLWLMSKHFMQVWMIYLFRISVIKGVSTAY